MGSIGPKTNEREPNRTSLSSGLPTGAVLESAEGYSIPQAGTTNSDPVDIVMMDAASLGNAICSRRVSCVEVMNAYLDHIENLNPKVNAIVALQERAGLLAQARERDAQVARGESMGPLHGFPHAVKDMQPVKGIRSTSGSPILRDFVPTADSLMVERLRKVGAIIIGKTNTSEFGLGSHTYNPVYGATRNAYDQSRSAGGAVAAAPLWRLLFVCCPLQMAPTMEGACAIRLAGTTSYGRVPRDARDVWLPSMNVLGPMARNVPDLAMLLSVQAGFDPRVPLAIEEDGAIFRRRLERNFKGTRVGMGRRLRRLYAV